MSASFIIHETEKHFNIKYLLLKKLNNVRNP